MLLPTEKLTRRSTIEHIQETIFECQKQVMDEYDRSGKIGEKTPKDWNDARWVAYEVCYLDARRHAGTKVPKWERPTPVK